MDLIGVEPTTPIVQGSVASIGMQARLSYASDPGWIRTIALLHVGQASWPLDHGTVLCCLPRELSGRESNTQNPRPGRGRFSVCVPGQHIFLLRLKWRVRELHPAGEAYETPLSTGPPASDSLLNFQFAGPGIEPGRPAL